MKLPRIPSPVTISAGFSGLGRALQESLGAREFGAEEGQRVIEFFGADPPECVFCGSQEVARWDHLVAIMSGGETVLGNIVPACQACDDSKRAEPFEEWMLSDVPRSPKSRGVKDIDRRVKRIEAYLQHFGYTPRCLEERLDKRELERLAAIRWRLQVLREDIEALSCDYRARTSLG